MLLFSTMVQRSNKSTGYLFDDTPRGLLEALVIAGGLTAALAVSPTLIVALGGLGFALKAGDKRRRKKLNSSLQYLKRNEYIRIRKTEKRISVEVTKTGEKVIQKHLRRRVIFSVPERPRVWDRKWRIILFDIPTHERVKRNAFRTLIRRLGAVMLQKSVWVYPFECSDQITLLREVFNFSNEELRLVVTTSIGEDSSFRSYFKL